jgi:hypothetical protein
MIEKIQFVLGNNSGNKYKGLYITQYSHLTDVALGKVNLRYLYVYIHVILG